MNSSHRLSGFKPQHGYGGSSGYGDRVMELDGASVARCGFLTYVQ